MRLLGKALTFDDVLLVPAYSQVLPKDTSLASQFSRHKPRLHIGSFLHYKPSRQNQVSDSFQLQLHRGTIIQ